MPTGGSRRSHFFRANTAIRYTPSCPAPGTKLHAFSNQLNTGIIDAGCGAAALMALQEGIRAKKHAALVGRTMSVIVDGVSTESDLLLDGRHEGQAPGIDGKVVLTDGTATPGSIVSAIVTQAGAHDLVASLDAEAAAQALASSA